MHRAFGYLWQAYPYEFIYTKINVVVRLKILLKNTSRVYMVSRLLFIQIFIQFNNMLQYTRVHRLV